MSENHQQYVEVLDYLKQKIFQARQKAAQSVNAELLFTYWEIGNTLLKQKKMAGWGQKIIANLARDLKIAFPEMKGLSKRNLVYMQSFASAWPYFPFTQAPIALNERVDIQSNTITQAALAQLPWYHHIALLDKLDKFEIRQFYLKKAIENGWSRNVMVNQIQSQLHLRQGNAITNFNFTLPKPISDLARETLKNPYLFDFLGIGEEIQERELEKALIQHIKKFMLELGRGFAYVGNQYNIQVENDDFFLDLLFYNYQLHCFIIFELKVGEFKPEYAGKLNFYINTINEQIKGKDDKPTIGVLLCKTPNRTVVQYSLKGIDTPIGVTEYELSNSLPPQFSSDLPTIEELEATIEHETKEIREQLNPTDERLRMLKEKIKGMDKEEIQTPATYPILFNIYHKGFRPLYFELIEKLSTLNDAFYNRTYNWNIGNMVFKSIDELDAFWENENSVRETTGITFNNSFWGFKKAGTEDLNDSNSLKMWISDYWYGFTLDNHNNQKPFMKRLYHQILSKDDKKEIIDLVVNKVMDRIDFFIDKINDNEQRQE